MKLVDIDVWETLKYRRTIRVQVPDDMEDSEIERVIKKAEKEDSLDAFVYTLDANCMESTGYDDSLDSPIHCEIECIDYGDVEDEQPI